MRSMAGLKNITPNVVINAFPALSDAKEITQESVLLNAIAAHITTLSAAREPTITQQAATTTPQVRENLSTVTIGAAQKTIPTVKEIAFPIP